MDAAIEPQKKGLSETDGRVSQGLTEDDGRVVIMKVMHNILGELIQTDAELNYSHIRGGRSIQLGWKLNNQRRKVLLDWLPKMDGLMPNVLVSVLDGGRQDCDIHDERIFENSDEEIASVLERSREFMLLK